MSRTAAPIWASVVAVDLLLEEIDQPPVALKDRQNAQVGPGRSTREKRLDPRREVGVGECEPERTECQQQVGSNFQPLQVREDPSGHDPRGLDSRSDRASVKSPPIGKNGTFGIIGFSVTTGISVANDGFRQPTTTLAGRP